MIFWASIASPPLWPWGSDPRGGGHHRSGRGCGDSERRTTRRGKRLRWPRAGITGHPHRDDARQESTRGRTKARSSPVGSDAINLWEYGFRPNRESIHQWVILWSRPGNGAQGWRDSSTAECEDDSNGGRDPRVLRYLQGGRGDIGGCKRMLRGVKDAAQLGLAGEGLDLEYPCRNGVRPMAGAVLGYTEIATQMVDVVGGADGGGVGPDGRDHHRHQQRQCRDEANGLFGDESLSHRRLHAEEGGNTTYFLVKCRTNVKPGLLD